MEGKLITKEWVEEILGIQKDTQGDYVLQVDYEMAIDIYLGPNKNPIVSLVFDEANDGSDVSKELPFIKTERHLEDLFKLLTSRDLFEVRRELVARALQDLQTIVSNYKGKSIKQKNAFNKQHAFLTHALKNLDKIFGF
jgi:hypothetical protein